MRFSTKRKSVGRGRGGCVEGGECGEEGLCGGGGGDCGEGEGGVWLWGGGEGGCGEGGVWRGGVVGRGERDQDKCICFCTSVFCSTGQSETQGDCPKPTHA